MNSILYIVFSLLLLSTFVIRGVAGPNVSSPSAPLPTAVPTLPTESAANVSSGSVANTPEVQNMKVNQLEAPAPTIDTPPPPTAPSVKPPPTRQRIRIIGAPGEDD